MRHVRVVANGFDVELAPHASFDIVSDINRQEVRNAVDQANKEIANRYDFKGSDAS